MTLTFLDRFRPRQNHPADPLTPAPVFPGLSQVRAYWEGLRPQGGLPRRAMLDPRGLSGMLDRVFVAERIGTGLALLRLSGSGLNDLGGADLRGLPLSCLFAAESRPLLSQSLERVFAEPALAELDLGADRGKVGAVAARMLLLPLADDMGGKLLLGALGFAADMRGPCKFQLLARREERVAPAMTDPAIFRINPQVAVDASSPSPTPAQRRHGHLTLVHFRD